jgi:hypothetical protein
MYNSFENGQSEKQEPPSPSPIARKRIGPERKVSKWNRTVDV